MSDSSQKSLLRSFPRVFWVANVMELFERGAYYGLNAVLAVYLTAQISKGGLGFTEESVGFLQSLIYALTYVVPILGGALADRYGYRRMLLFAFSLMTAGYFLSGQMSSYGTVFACLLVMATGGGLFKPIISGTIARSTNEENSGFGFGVYYWMINVGAFLAPLLVSYIKGFSWSYVFDASAIYCALMLFVSFFMFKDPPKPTNTKTIKEVLGSAAMVLGDARFMLMIFVYSGFWILYFQNFGSVLWFLRDFIDATPVNNLFATLHIPFKFDPEFVTIINAATIIILQVFVSRIVKNAQPILTMTSGILIGVAGFVCLAFATNVWIFIIGIVIFSVGEMTAHPKYYSYIGLVAPTDKTAVYMGYSFLYGVIGALVGSSFGGVLYEAMLKPLVGQPGVQGDVRNFWLLFAALGVAATVGLFLYNKYFYADTPETNKRAAQIMLGLYIVIAFCALLFFYKSVFGDVTISYKMMVQAIIMLLVGGGGIVISLKHRKR